MAQRLIDDVFDALDEQTVVVPSTAPSTSWFPYYDKQRARGKTHTQALLRLARQRISVLFAMLRDGTLYEPRVPGTAAA